MLGGSVHHAHLKKVYCLPYIQGVRVRLGYSPKGGTISVNVSARKTKLAGSTIYKRQTQSCTQKTQQKTEYVRCMLDDDQGPDTDCNSTITDTRTVKDKVC